MSDLDPEHYRALVSRLSLDGRALIDGKRCDTADVFETVNPAKGEPLAVIAHCGTEDVDRAVAAARRSVTDGRWSRASPEYRKEVLLKLADLIRANAEALAVIESLESGKPIRDCLNEIGVEVPNCFQWYGELADKVFGKIAPTDDGATALIVKEPVGVVGVVLPWNFPLLMAAWKLAPALAAGCSIVVKPAEQTSLTALRLADLAVEAGIPDGVVNIVPGLGETTGAAIGLHGDIDAVTFTGSTEIGRKFMRYSADSNLKTVGLEMGGKSPFIVLDDAPLSAELIENAVQSAFWNAGQNCSANMRQIVGRKRYEEYLHAVSARAEAIVVGDPLDPLTEMGPLISEEHRSKVVSYLDLGRSEGASPVLDKAKMPGPGFYLGPTVFAGLGADMRIAKEEIFGPVLGVLPVDGVEGALTVANSTEYGLHATVFTQDIDAALYLSKRLECGTVAVNGFSEGDIKTPFGGFKQSGSLARDKGIEALDQYLRSKTIWITAKEPRT